MALSFYIDCWKSQYESGCIVTNNSPFWSSTVSTHVLICTSKNLYESCTKLNRAVEKLCKRHICVLLHLELVGRQWWGERSEQIDALWWPPPNQQNQCPARASLLLMIVSSTLIVQAFLTAQMNFDHYFWLLALSFHCPYPSLSCPYSLSIQIYAKYCKKVKAQYFWKTPSEYISSLKVQVG